MIFSKIDDANLARLKRARNRKMAAPGERQRFERIRHIAESEGTVSALSLERILGKSDLFDITYLERGLMAGQPVCRVTVLRDFTRTYGTGFMVSPRLMLTNNHVLETLADALQGFTEFRYEIGPSGLPLRPVSFRLAPEQGFLTDVPLDYTLVAVEPLSDDGEYSLGNFGFLRLGGRSTKITEGEYVSIIQHPNGDYKKIAMRENRLIQYGGEGDLASFLWYFCDTARGSSGAPVFNDSWQVAGLHHSGVPDRKTQDGQTLYRTKSNGYLGYGEIEARGLVDDIVWIANEGVRISKIIGHAVERHRSEPQGDLIAAMLDDAMGIAPFAGATPGLSIVAPPVREVSLSPTEVSTPPRERPDLGTVDRGSVSCRNRTTAYFEGRKGYDPDFLCNTIPMPKISDRALDYGRPAEVEGADDNILRYHHFSIIMNADRQLAFVAAVNIDGRRSRGIRRIGDDTWCFDPRVERSDQAGNDLYKNEIWHDGHGRRRNNWFDRGHLVRRLDPVWGPPSVAEAAEIDSFQWTNCAPQYFSFNQNWWLGLEKYVLNNIDNDDARASVFNGPVFNHDDEEHRGMRIPQYYFKLVVVGTRGRDLVSSAFVLDQKRFARDLPFEEAPVGNYGGYQTSVELLESETGLNFGDVVRNADVRRGQTRDSIPIREIEDIDLSGG